MAVETGAEWPGWVQNTVSGGLAALAALGVAHFNKRAALEKAQADQATALQNTIDDRIRLILVDDEKTIRRLSSKIDALEKYVRLLISAMMKAGVEAPPMPLPAADD